MIYLIAAAVKRGGGEGDSDSSCSSLARREVASCAMDYQPFPKPPNLHRSIRRGRVRAYS